MENIKTIVFDLDGTIYQNNSFASIEKNGCLYVTPEQRMHEIGRPENDNSPF